MVLSSDLGGVKQYVYGTNGIFGWLQVINPQTGFDSSVLAAIIACAVSFIAAIILMMTVGKDSIPEKQIRILLLRRF